MLKAIAARIWAVWGIAVFVISLLLVFPVFLWLQCLGDPAKSIRAYQVFQRWMQVVLPLLGIRIKVSGLENFKKGKSYVVVCNHRSFMDIPVTTTRIPGPNKTIAKIEMSRIPIFGTIYKTGSVLVNRKDARSRAESYQLMKKVLEQKLHMLIYPEGTRNNSKQSLTRFHSGAFNLAVETGTDIIPATLRGTDDILPNKKFLYLLPGTIHFDILPALAPGNDAEALKSKVYQMMESRLLQENGGDQSP